MKLRNKHTKQVIEYSIELKEWSEDEREWFTYANYDTIDDLREDWEDYEPKEPLIKDEKIRKAVRVWADAMGLDAVDYEEGEFGTVFYSTDNMDDCKYRIEFCQFLDYLKNGYDCIADLCGEEEE